MRKLPDGAAAEADKAVNAVLKYPGAKWSLAVKNRRAILLAVGPPQAAPREWIIRPASQPPCQVGQEAVGGVPCLRGKGMRDMPAPVTRQIPISVPRLRKIG